MGIIKKIIKFFDIDKCEMAGNDTQICEKIGKIAHKSNSELLIYNKHVKNIIQKLKMVKKTKKIDENSSKMTKNDYKKYKKLVDFTDYIESEIDEIFTEISKYK